MKTFKNTLITPLSISAVSAKYAQTFLIVLSIFCFISCSEDELVKPPPVPSISFQEGLDRVILNGFQSTGTNLTYHWTASTGVTIQNAFQSSAYFKFPPNAGSTIVTLTVNDGKKEASSQQDISFPALTQSRAFGLGKELTAEHDNTVPYEWYFDQSLTGPASSVNCGPTCVTMATKWFNESFTGTPLDARNTYPMGGGWWYTNNIINYLNGKNVTNWTVPLSNMNIVKDEIDEGNLVILCLDMYYVSNGSSPDYRVDKFYNTNGTGWGHFIIVKGYKIVDNKLFFEIYDPYSFGNKYEDQTLKGKNRYYRSNDLDAATGIWWDYAIVISKGLAGSGRTKGVDVNNIVHMPGR
jgi:hypothetical protein